MGGAPGGSLVSTEGRAPPHGALSAVGDDRRKHTSLHADSSRWNILNLFAT